MRVSIIPSKPIDLVFHKTHEIVRLIEPEKCDLVVTMNATASVLSSICSKDCVVYLVSTASNPKKFVGKPFFVLSVHYKLYRTPTRVIFSTANASLSSFNEVSIIFDRNDVPEQFISSLLAHLEKSHSFIKRFW
ncbi:MAG: hypothetical protein DSY42_09745 [Aquifex sp.]|nr:MAG: hypothetical protein DSY42_09745 [Aquifex sp.]